MPEQNMEKLSEMEQMYVELGQGALNRSAAAETARKLYARMLAEVMDEGRNIIIDGLSADSQLRHVKTGRLPDIYFLTSTPEIREEIPTSTCTRSGYLLKIVDARRRERLQGARPHYFALHVPKIEPEPDANSRAAQPLIGFTYGQTAYVGVLSDIDWHPLEPQPQRLELRQ